MKTFFKIIWNIIFVVLIIVLGCFLYLNVMYSMNKSKVPSIMGIRMMTVLTGSMEPTIDPGDVIIIRESQELKTGDIITFKRDAIIITHRIIEKIEDENGIGYKTKGDNNNVEDNFIVPPKSILGKYVFRIPKMGYVMEFFRSKMGLLIIGGVIGLVVIFEVVKAFVVKRE